MSLDGGRKGDSVAEAITRDVGKYLFFCDPRGVKWSMVASKDQIRRLDVIKNNTTILMAIPIILKIPGGKLA